MKKLLLSCFIILPFIGWAQDTIVLNTKEEIYVRIVEVTPELVKYYLTGTESPQYTISKTNVEFIKFGDGRLLFFSAEPAQLTPIDTIYYSGSKARLIRMTPCRRGQYDARHFHETGGKNFVAGFLGGIYGVIAVAIIPPSAPRWDLATPANITDSPGYHSCYKERAKNKNMTYALAGWGTRSAIFLILILSGL